MGDVLDFPTRLSAESGDNLTCAECGGSWWKVPGVVVDNAGHVTGYGLPLTCLECSDDS